jgi:hypothetical protein
MAVIDITTGKPPVTPKPKRPTVATPVLAHEAAEKQLGVIDADLDCLYCIAGMLAAAPDVPDEAVDALWTLHARMQRAINTLYTLG